MYHLIESADYPTLLARYLQDYDHYSRADPLGDLPLIVPTLPVGNILIQTLASTRGVAAGITLRFWHNYEWMLIERIIGQNQRGSQAPLGKTAIRWELFSYLYQHGDTILADPAHPQHALLRGLYPAPDNDTITHDHTRRLWVYSGQLADLYTAYLNQRPDWITAWQSADPPPLDNLLKGAALKTLPSTLAEHYRASYRQQSRLWHDRFAAIHAERERRRAAFWHTLETRDSAHRLLPPYIPVFAPTHMRAAEHEFMRRLGKYTDLSHYHLAASNSYLDDIVDSRWLRELKRRSPSYASAKHYDHGHTLVSRYGKEQRDLASLLHKNSDPETLHPDPVPPHNLLSALQTEIRELREEHVAAYLAENIGTTHDDSLRIHGCHSLQRQCETLRSDIVAWLNADPARRLSDIYIHLPDPAAEQTILRATFPPDGDYDGNRLPARLIGVTENPAETLWRSLAGRYTLINGRFDAPTVLDWLHNEDTCRSLGISAEHMQRITAALIAAGYRRGFDGAHLQPTLHDEDHDHRYTYTYALNRLIAGVLTPDAEHYLEAVPQNGLTLADLPALEALATLAEHLHEQRALQAQNTPAQTWLENLRATLRDAYTHAHNSPAWQTLDQALDDLQNQLAAHQALAPQNEQHYLPLAFILENIETQLAAQQTSSEPSGVITIGSLKNLRNLPGKLLVFLNADRDRYPARQNDERYNLIHLDERQPGDTNREHEDLGALLDLITRAGDALWIYYNNDHDNEPQPPASPIQELLQYLDEQHERARQHLREQGETDAAENLPRTYHCEHPADPFQPDPNETRPAPLWEKIRTTLQQNPPPPQAALPPPVGEGRGSPMKKADAFFMGPRGGGSKLAASATTNTTPCHTPPPETATNAPPPSQKNKPLSLRDTQRSCEARERGWGEGLNPNEQTKPASSPATLANMPPSPCGGGDRDPMKKADAFFMGTRGGGSKLAASATTNTTPCHTPPPETATNTPRPSQDALASAAGEGWGGGSDRETVATVASLAETLVNMPPSPCGGGDRDPMEKALPFPWEPGGGVRPQTSRLNSHPPRSETATDAPSSTNTLPPPVGEGRGSPMKKADAFFMGTRGGGSKPAASATTTNQPTYIHPERSSVHITPPFLPLHVPPTLAADAAPQAPENLTLAQLVRDLQKPASAYARAHHIANTAAENPPESREPLALDGLSNWQAEQHIITALEQNHPDPAVHIARLPAYPGGISGQIQLEQRLATYRARQQTLLAHANLGTWPTLREQALPFAEHASLTAPLPTNSATWPRLSASRANPKHHARYWLEHLAWNATGARGTTLIHYADDTLLRLAPLPAAEALRQLRQWLAVREHLQQTLWLAPLELMQPYLETFNGDKAADKQATLIRAWIDDDRNKHDSGDLWRHLWRGNETRLAATIAAALASHAPLLQPLLAHSETLT